MVRRLVLVGLLIVGLLGIGGYIGWMQGYDAGLVAEGNVGTYAPYGFGIFGFFMKVLLFLFIFFLISKLLFFGAWRHKGRHGGHWGGGWREWHERHHEEMDEGKGPPRNTGGGDDPIVA